MKRSSPKIHPGWIAVAVTFVTLMATAGFRSAPTVLVVPLEDAFGWSRSDISLAIAINLILFGLVSPIRHSARGDDCFNHNLNWCVSDDIY